MWLTQQLGDEHDLTHFESGQASLDEWLRREARRMQRQDVERVFVWTAADDPVVVAFYSIKPTQVSSASVSRGLSGGHSVVPGWLLSRWALDRDQQGRGLGGQLLRDALERCVLAAGIGAGRVILVDPVDDAARGFYQHHGFTETKSGGRLVMKVATARHALRLG